MNPLFQLVADQFTPAADDPAAGIAAPDKLRALCRATVDYGSTLRPLTLSQKTYQAFQGQDLANQPQATRGVIRLLELRPELAVAAAVDPVLLGAAAEKDESYDLAANAIGQIESSVEDGLLALRAAQRDGAERLVTAVRRRHAELAADPEAQAELLLHFGAMDINARILEDRANVRTQRSERRERDASAQAEDTRAQAEDEAAMARLLGDTRGKQG